MCLASYPKIRKGKRLTDADKVTTVGYKTFGGSYQHPLSRVYTQYEEEALPLDCWIKAKDHYRGGLPWPATVRTPILGESYPNGWRVYLQRDESVALERQVKVRGILAVGEDGGRQTAVCREILIPRLKVKGKPRAKKK